MAGAPGGVGKDTNVTVISASQLASIKQKLAPPAHESSYEDRLHRQTLSKARADTWQNTLQAQRARKERARVERLAAEEAERCKADVEEAKLRAKQRQVVIERANKMLFDETDKVKGFHGAMLMSDVLKEREHQIHFRNQVDSLHKAQEEAFTEQMKRQLELAEQAELDKMMQRKAAALQQKADQQAQLDELKASIIATREADRREGRILKSKAQEEAADMKAKEEAARAARIKANQQTKQANEMLQRFKQAEAAREAEADLAIEAYAARKADLMAERARREAERENEKEGRRARMVAIMEANLAAMRKENDAALERDVRAADAAARADAAERQRLRDEEWVAIDASRKQQLAIKAERAAMSKQADHEFVQAWQTRTKELREEEEAEARMRREMAIGTVAFQQHQARLKEQKAAMEHRTTMQEAAQLETMKEDQERQFQAYARRQIDDYAGRGMDIKPMTIRLSKKKQLGVE